MERRPIVLVQALVILAAVAWIYWPALHGAWWWDDTTLISNNALIHDPGGWWKIWLQPQEMFDFQPVEVSVLWLQWHVWGTHTSGYHAVNALLHATSALLVWRLLSKLGLRFAWLGGLLFAVHPVMVESVAWMSELKNTLSLPPFLLAMGAYLDYEARGKKSDYFWALGLFLVAMLCKTSMAMFPFIILLHAWCKRGRISVADLKASAPFFAVSLVVGSLAVWFLHQAATTAGLEVGDVPPGGIVSRLYYAVSILSFYFGTSLAPVGLVPIYAKGAVDLATLFLLLSAIIFIGLLVLFWFARRTWGRMGLLGLGFFAINLLPFLGLTPAPYMGFTWVADHILYLPIIGLIGLAVGGVGILSKASGDRYVVPATMGLFCLLLAYASHSYAGLFRDSEMIWTYTVAHNPEAWPAQFGLGTVLMGKGDAAGAAEQFRKTIELCPDYAKAHANLGLAYVQLGRLDDALTEFQTAVRLNPTSAETDYNLGTALLKKGRAAEAIPAFQLALRLNPASVNAHFNLGLALAETGQVTEAMDEYRAVLAIDPHYSAAHRKLADLLMQSGNPTEAAQHYDAAQQNGAPKN